MDVASVPRFIDFADRYENQPPPTSTATPLLRTQSMQWSIMPPPPPPPHTHTKPRFPAPFLQRRRMSYQCLESVPQFSPPSSPPPHPAPPPDTQSSRVCHDETHPHVAASAVSVSVQVHLWALRVVRTFQVCLHASRFTRISSDAALPS